jgi:hypothetical protein
MYYLNMKKLFILAFLVIAVNSEEDDENSFSHQWETRMSDYSPDFVNIIPLPYRRKEMFYEHIKLVPTRLRGAFLLDETKNEKIDFQIIDTEGRTIYAKTGSHDIFDLNITEAGLYRIIFTNDYVWLFLILDLRRTKGNLYTQYYTKRSS